MRISASLYSNPSVPLEQMVKDLDLFLIDYIHVDCRDDLRVFADIAALRKISRTPVDLHLITPTPTRYFDLIVEHQIEQVAFQLENIREELSLPSGFNGRFGVALLTNTPIEAFAPYEKICSFVLFMATVPGESGGAFNVGTFERIREFRARYPSKQVHVDGGVNEEISFALKSLGVSCIVSGSYLVGAENLPRALLNLKQIPHAFELKVKDFMIPVRKLVTLQRRNAVELRSVLQAMQESGLGFTLVVDDDMMLSGLITDGDIRRLLLRNIDALQGIDASQAINADPVVIDADATIGAMLEKVHQIKRPILYLPVVDSNKRLVGSVSFSDLVKGEL